MAESIQGAKDLARYYMEKDIPVFMHGPPGVGKCLGKGTPVLMFDGKLKLVEDVEKGDLLMGPDSKPRKVLSVTQGNAPLFKINPTKGASYVVNSDHVLSLKTSPKNPGELSKIVNVSVQDYLQLSNTQKHHLKGWRSGVDWAAQAVKIDPYIFGVWLGDGRKSGPCFTNMEPEIIDACKDYALSFGGGITHYKNYAFRLTEKPWYEGGNSFIRSLRSYGLGGANAKFIPWTYLANDRQTRLEVLAGLIDTDGCLVHNCYEISQVSEQLRDGVLFLARSLGLAATVRETVASIELGGKTQYRMFISGHIEIIPVRVARKKAAPRQQKKNVLVTGIKLEAIGNGPYYGFTLDKDGLFLLGDFTVTHNSDSWRQIANEQRIGLIDIRLGMMDPVDLLGLPSVINGVTNWARPAWLPDVKKDGERGIILFDELSDCPRAMQSVTYQIILNRCAGPHRLPDGWYPCAAGNRREDKAAAQALSTALANRFAHIDVMPDVKAFLNWGNQNEIDPLLLGFIRFRPALLHDMRGNDLRAFPTPRSWAKASAVCGADASLRFRLMAGLVGDGAASEFETYMKTLDLPSLEEIISDPKKCKIPTEPSSKYALSSMLAHGAKVKNIDAIYTYISRPDFGRDFCICCVMDATSRDSSLTNTKAFLKFATENADIQL